MTAFLGPRPIRRGWIYPVLTVLTIVVLTALLAPEAGAQRRPHRHVRVITGSYPTDHPLDPGTGLLGSGGFSFLRVTSQGVELAPWERFVQIKLKDDSGMPVYASIDRGKAPPGHDVPNDVVPPYGDSDRIRYFCDKTPGPVPIPSDGLVVFGVDVMWLTIYEDPCPQDLTKIKPSLASGTFTITLMDRPPDRKGNP